MPPSILAGKSVLLTGGAGGIGRALALRIADSGGAVMVTDVDDVGGHRTADLVRAAGGKAEYLHCDVRESAEALAAVDATVAAFGRLDGAVNNAGWEGSPALLADYDEDAWDRIIAVNLTGVFLCMRHELRVMLQQEGGSIVNIASISGVIGNPEFVPYNATKHGVLGLTKGSALETAQSGVRVNSVCPGFVDTEMVVRIGGTPGSKTRVAAEQAHPMGRLARPEEVADAAVWLLSDLSSFVTGQGLLVDGGYVAR